MSSVNVRPLDFEAVDNAIGKLDLPGFAPSQDTTTPQQLTWVQATTTWFRQSEATGTSVLWIVTTNDRTVYRSVTQSWLADWQSVIMNAQVLWVQVDADNIIRAWQPGKAFS